MWFVWRKGKMKIANKIILLVVFLIFSRFSLADVQISNLQDIQFGSLTYPFNEDLSYTNSICVYNSNRREKYYRINVSGMHDSNGKFYLSNGNSTIQYGIKWTGGRTTQDLTPNQGYSFRGASSKVGCRGTPDKKLPQMEVYINSSFLSPAPKSGNYSDTITILLEPPY